MLSQVFLASFWPTSLHQGCHWGRQGGGGGKEERRRKRKNRRRGREGGEEERREREEVETGGEEDRSWRADEREAGRVNHDELASPPPPLSTPPGWRRWENEFETHIERARSQGVSRRLRLSGWKLPASSLPFPEVLHSVLPFHSRQLIGTGRRNPIAPYQWYPRGKEPRPLFCSWATS